MSHHDRSDPEVQGALEHRSSSSSISFFLGHLYKQTGFTFIPAPIDLQFSYQFQIRNQQSLIDLIVAMIAIPTLVLLALTLEAKMREDWMEKEETRWAVLGIGLGLLCASLFTCGYVTHRMGVCLWAGPQEDDTYPANLTRVSVCTKF
jgi:hypothetical protein